MENTQEQVLTVVETEEEPKGIFKKAFNKIQKGYTRFRTSTGGRWAIRGGKAILIGLSLYESYKYGKNSAKPVAVYVSDPKDPTDENAEADEDEVIEEEPVEEAAE